MRMTIGQCGTLACLLEVSAPKPGNVHRGADFDDTTFLDFAASAIAIGPVLDRAVTQPVGQTIREAVSATREVSGTNTNLGIILLLVPLAMSPATKRCRAGFVKSCAIDAGRCEQCVRGHPRGQSGRIDAGRSACR